MRIGYLIVFALVALTVSCKVLKPTTSQISATIIEGSGIQGISVGDNINDVLKVIGKPSNFDEEYYSFYDKGVDFAVEDNKVHTIFLYYISKVHQPFNGQTETGINKESTIEEVIERYGEPERIGKSILSSYSGFPGQEDYNLNYYSKGITFTFYNKKLADIRVFKKK